MPKHTKYEGQEYRGGDVEIAAKKNPLFCNNGSSKLFLGYCHYSPKPMQPWVPKKIHEHPSPHYSEMLPVHPRVVAQRWRRKAADGSLDGNLPSHLAMLLVAKCRPAFQVLPTDFGPSHNAFKMAFPKMLGALPSLNPYAVGWDEEVLAY